jgi:hypothetical protein
VDNVDTLLKGIPHFIAQGPLYVVSSLLMFGGIMVAAFTRNECYHKFFAIYFVCHTIAISFAIFPMLIIRFVIGVLRDQKIFIAKSSSPDCPLAFRLTIYDIHFSSIDVVHIPARAN